MTQMNKICKTLLPLLATVLLALPGSLLHADGGEDWVLVKRFEEQQAKAKSGNPRAMYEVGRMYERGRGTAANMDKAISWFEKAAGKGQTDARARLGILFLEGQGVPQNYAKAYENLSAAANAGVPPAQYFLAVMYEEGQGVKANPGAAMSWYKKAAKGGYYQAEKAIARLEAEARRPSIAQPPEATRQAKAAPAPQKPKPNLAQGLIETVLNGRWHRNNKPVGFLPSSASTCTQEGKEIKCLSGELSRDTGFSVITYVTEATLNGFSANDEFSVSYHNNVLRTDQDKPTTTASEDDEEYSASTTTAVSRVKLGRQKTEHHLECKMETATRIVCVKNLTTTQTFVSNPN